MNRPSIEEFKISVGNSSLIQWGPFADAQSKYIDYLEEQIAEKEKQIVIKDRIINIKNLKISGMKKMLEKKKR